VTQSHSSVVARGRVSLPCLCGLGGHSDWEECEWEQGAVLSSGRELVLSEAEPPVTPRKTWVDVGFLRVWGPVWCVGRHQAVRFRLLMLIWSHLFHRLVGPGEIWVLFQVMGSSWLLKEEGWHNESFALEILNSNLRGARIHFSGRKTLVTLL
jgi:hypothetical protein